MPRANRHFIPGYIWHITHRCHKKEFLLKFKKDKQRWLRWFFEAKKRYGLCILNYIAVGNKGFIKAWKEIFKIRGKCRKVGESQEGYELREPPVPYGDVFEGEKEFLRGNNTIIWDEYSNI